MGGTSRRSELRGEYVVNVKRQGNWEFVLQQFKDAKVEADKVRSLLLF
jgi:hypothetical protein